MSSPKPKVPLTGKCSVIRDNTLYVYSADAFQSLPLDKHAKWTKLEMGVPVSGAACALMQESGEDTLWVIGGATNNTDYTGLQQYSFSQDNWTTVTPVVQVTKNRQGHVVAPLPGASAVLVYSGSQNGNPAPSVETFLISTKEPYGVQSYISHNVPGNEPFLLPWDATSAITIGGASGDTEIFMFASNGAGGEWSKYETQLKEPLKDSSQQEVVIVDGSDNSKVLEIFDMSVSPAIVERIVLQDANGKPAAVGQTVGGQSNNQSLGRRRRRRRDLTLNNWPSYNSTFAPTIARTNFAIAQASTGLVAITGGDNESPIELFSEEQNSWVDTKEFFGQQSVIAQTVSATSSIPASTSSMPSFSTPAAITPTSKPPPANHHPHTSRDLGAILGSILGFIAVMLLILALIAWRRRKLGRQKVQDENDDEKHRLSFADRGAPFMKEAGGAVSYPRDPRFDSLAIIGTQPMSNHRRSATHGSNSSTARLVPQKGNAFGMSDAVEMEVIREKSRTPTGTATLEVPKSNNLSVKPKRSSGWSRYFSGADMLSIQSKSPRNSQRPASSSQQSTMSQRKSLGAQSTGSVHDCSSHGPTEIPPLELGHQFNEAGVRESVGDASVATQRREVAQSRPSTLSRASSTFSSISGSVTSDLAMTHDRQDESTQWTPVTGSTWSAARPRDTGASSVYDITDLGSFRKSSLQQPSSLVYSDMRASTNPFLAATNTGNAAKRPSIVNPGVGGEKGTTTIATSITFPVPPISSTLTPTSAAATKKVAEVGVVPNPQNAATIPPPPVNATNHSLPPTTTKAVVNSDASWLNLGAVSSRG